MSESGEKSEINLNNSENNDSNSTAGSQHNEQIEQQGTNTENSSQGTSAVDQVKTMAENSSKMTSADDQVQNPSSTEMCVNIGEDKTKKLSKQSEKKSENSSKGKLSKKEVTSESSDSTSNKVSVSSESKDSSVKPESNDKSDKQTEVIKSTSDSMLTKDDEETSSNSVPEIADSSDDEHDEGICLGDGTDLDEDGRNKMFEKGLSCERNGKRNKALKCYLACLNGLKKGSRFPLLPQCLRNIADIFYQKEEYDKAVHFIQAEKVYYESALIDTTDIQHQLEEAQLKEGGLPLNMTTDTVRASEYEHLAKLCLDKGQPQLALEYAGKATKLRQQVLGDKDPVTIESLDFFASVYAKVGAEQYEESLKKFSDKSADGEESAEVTSGGGTGDHKEPVSILRKRKNSEKEKKVHFDESQLQSHVQKQTEERFAKSVLWALLVICFILLLILGVYLYCNLVGSHTCSKFRGDLHYAYMRLKYWYYQYQGGPNTKFM